MKISKYDRIVKPRLDIIEGWARNGLTLEDIAHNLGLSKPTLVKYKREHDELRRAIEDGKEIADIRVENALYRKACGFISTEKKYIKLKDGMGGERMEEVEVEVYHPPDTTAIIFWLKNRKPKAWRDKVTFEEEAEEVQEILQITKREVNGKNGSLGTTAETS